MTDYIRTIVLEAVFNDSDSQTDYYHPDARVDRWYVKDLPGNRVTEAALRNAFSSLPEWLRQLEWEYTPGKVYSMSRHSYGYLRCKSDVDFGFVKGAHAYGGGDRGVNLLIETDSRGPNDTDDPNMKPIPASLEMMRQYVLDWNTERDNKDKEREDYMKTPEYKRKALEAKLRDAKSTTAVIDQRGFHQITPEERAANIAKIEAEIAELDHSTKLAAVDNLDAKLDTMKAMESVADVATLAKSGLGEKVLKMTETFFAAQNMLERENGIEKPELYIGARLFACWMRLILEQSGFPEDRIPLLDANVDRLFVKFKDHFNKTK